MNNELNQLKNKIKLILGLINTEYKNIIEQYSEDNLYVKSLPLKPSKKCLKVQKDMINKELEDIFIPTLKTISPMLDDGIFVLGGMQ